MPSPEPEITVSLAGPRDHAQAVFMPGGGAEHTRAAPGNRHERRLVGLSGRSPRRGLVGVREVRSDFRQGALVPYNPEGDAEQIQCQEECLAVLRSWLHDCGRSRGSDLPGSRG